MATPALIFKRAEQLSNPAEVTTNYRLVKFADGKNKTHATLCLMTPLALLGTVGKQTSILRSFFLIYQGPKGAYGSRAQS